MGNAGADFAVFGSKGSFMTTSPGLCAKLALSDFQKEHRSSFDGAFIIPGEAITAA